MTLLENTLCKIQSNEFTISVFGLGYVGFPLSVRLAMSGFKVIGVDTDSRKIEDLKNNTLIESQREFQEDFSQILENGNFSLSEHPIRSNEPRIGIICVPTPVPNGDVNSETFVFSAIEKFLDTSKRGDILIIESSVRGGTTDKAIQMVKSRGYSLGEDFGVCFCPERIDPLNKKWKLENIPRIISASDDTTYQIAQKMYEPVNNSNLYRVSSPKVAETVKSFENAFRLVNISLVNELAMLCDKQGINVNEVTDAAATKPFGFMPFSSGAGAGGHCIPKDSTFLTDSAKQNGMNFFSIENAIETNHVIPRYIAGAIEKTLDEMHLQKSVLVCGLAYKPDVEDMRDSPGFKIANEFSERKFAISAYDPYYKDELTKKYLIENHLGRLDFEIKSNLDYELIKEYDCICIVQHHAKTRQLLEQIYKKGLVPLVYDCQNKISYDPKSKTILKGLGYTTNEMKYLQSQSILT